MLNALTRLAALIATCAALSLAGCGGGGSPVDAPTGPNITATGGGTVTSTDGRVRLTVPPGAAPRDMTLRIVPATPDAPPTVGVLEGYGYALEGDGELLSASATVQLTLDANALPAAARHGRRHALATSVKQLPPIQCDLEAGLLPTPVDYGDLDGAWYCKRWPPEPVLATITRDAVALLGTCAFESASRTVSCLTLDLRPQIFGALYDSEPPAVSVTADLAVLVAAGDAVITATATDNKGLASVGVSLSRSVNGVIDPASVQTTVFGAPPYQVTRSFTAADNGVWTVVAAATDFNGNTTVTDGLLTLTVNIPAPPGPDTTAPTVALSASSTTVTVGDTVTLNATASDDVGVAKVEFYRGALKLGEDLAAPYAFSPAAYTAADVGTPQVYTAKAFDGAGNTANSAPLTVTVSAASPGAVYVNAASGSDGHAGTAAAPYKTLQQAFSQVPANGTVWLQNGQFTLASEGADGVTGRTVPVNVTVQAVNDGGATLGFPLRFAGSGAVSGVQFDISGNAGIVATSGTVTVSQPTWVKLGSVSMSAAIQASGSAKVFVDPKGNPAHSYFADAGVGQLSSLSDSAELTVNGGVVDRLSGGGAGYMNLVSDSSRLTLNNVSWIDSTGVVVAPTVVEVLAGAGQLVLNHTTIDLTGGIDFNGGGNACIRVRALPGELTTQTIALTNSLLKGCPGDGIQVRGGTPTITLSASAITGAGYYGLRAGKVFNQPEEARPVLNLINSQIAGNRNAGIDLNGGGTVSMAGATIGNNGLQTSEGGLRLRDARPYTLTMRNTQVTDNVGGATNGGVELQGDAGSSFDLGTQASPGGNTLQFNGAASTGLRLGVATGVTVQAVGNTWNAGAQGADPNGRYSVPSSTCSTSPCDLSVGSGVNFVIGSGTLRLVDD